MIRHHGNRRQKYNRQGGGVGHRCHGSALDWKAVKGGDGSVERKRCRTAVQNLPEFGGCRTSATNPSVTAQETYQKWELSTVFSRDVVPWIFTFAIIANFPASTLNSASNAKLLAYETEICGPILLIILVIPSNRYHKGVGTVPYKKNWGANYAVSCEIARIKVNMRASQKCELACEKECDDVSGFFLIFYNIDNNWLYFS